MTKIDQLLRKLLLACAGGPVIDPDFGNFISPIKGRLIHREIELKHDGLNVFCKGIAVSVQGENSFIEHLLGFYGLN